MAIKSKIKLKKYLSNAGYCSRRKAADFIESNSITINSEKAEHDAILEHGDVIVINKNKEIVNLKVKTDILIYHKPTGEICSSIESGANKSVFQSIPIRQEGKWIMVGRLDVNTSGLLIFSNNGDLVQKLSHPSSMIEREYLCRILGNPTKSQINKLLNGTHVEGKKSHFDKLIPIKKKSSAVNNWFRVTLHSGRNREVRKLWDTQSLQVNRLIRIGFGPIMLPKDLKAGQYKLLMQNEINNVLKLVDSET
ncbi:MAG TPA: pseudouridine synthase [Gammaproteobacteria bacterium]|nr:pseudouridine synthase [Gammaproteobacteria bacterium]